MIQLGDLSKIVAGRNIYRLPESEKDRVYTMAEFEDDYYQMKLAPRENEIIYQQSGTLPHIYAAVLSEAHRQKIISQIFSIIRVDATRLDPWYLCYQLNESQKIAEQSYAAVQGSVIRRYTAKELRELKIPLPPLLTQQQIGRIYVTALYQKYLANKQAEQRLAGVLAILRDVDETQRRETNGE